MNSIQTEEAQDTMSVYLDREYTSNLSRAISPTDKDYSSLEEGNFDNDIDVYSFSVEGLTDQYSDDDEDFEIYKENSKIAFKQTISYISEIKLVFDYPQASLPPIA